MSPSPTCRLRRSAPSGMTVIELLVATTLSTLLLVAVLGLLTVLARQVRLLTAAAPAEPWHTVLAEQLQRDLANARQIVVAPDRLVLIGYLGSEGSPPQWTLRAAEVTYQVTDVGGLACLWRDERSLDDMTNLQRARALLATGIDRLELTSADRAGGDETYSGPVPRCGSLRLRTSTTPRPIMELRWVR